MLNYSFFITFFLILRAQISVEVFFTQHAQVSVKEKKNHPRTFSLQKNVMFRSVSKMTADDVSSRCIEFIKGE